MAMSTGDVNQIVSAINMFWPEFRVTKEIILNPTPQFTMNFYHKFLLKIDELLASVHCPDNTYFLGDLLDLCPPEINKDLFFYIHLNKWIVASSITYFKLMDLYQPVKRSKTTIKFAVNFIVYCTNNLFKCKEITESLYEEKDSLVELHCKVDSLKDNIAKISYDVGVEYEKHDDLVAEYNTTLKEEAELMDIKIKNDTELKQLDYKVKSLLELVRQNKEQLDNLNKEEESLYEQLVSEEEYNGYLKIISDLNDKLQQLDKADAEYLENLETKISDVEYFDKLLVSIKEIDFTDLDIVDAIESTNKELANVDEARYVAEIDAKKCAIKQTMQDNIVLDDSYKAQTLEIDTALRKMGDSIKGLEKKHDAALSCNMKLIKEGEKLDSDIETTTQVCNSLEQNMKSLCSFHVNALAQMVQAERAATAEHMKFFKK